MKTEPNHLVTDPYEGQHNMGLTKREHFAGLALQGMVAKYGTDYQENHGKEAVYMADNLIEALNRTEP